jgi:cytochrome d ubiquinol oxidase subunit II
VPSLVFGVAFGNLLQGVPFRIDSDLRVLYEGGGLFELLNPFGLLCGLVSVAMLTTHGAVYLTVKADGPVKERAAAFVHIGALATVALFVIGGIWIAFGIDGYAITSGAVVDGPSNPLLKTVALARGQWLHNYGTYKWMMLAPALGILGPLATLSLTAGRRHGLAFVTSAIGILGIISTAGVSMFPFLMPSDIMPLASLTVWDATSSQLTLFVMLVATLIFLPIVLIYTGFVFRVLKGSVNAKQIEGNSANLY